MPIEHLKYRWRRIRHFIVVKVLHADDSPHRIALGVAIGLFIAWTPTVGLQMLLALAAAAVLRANKIIPVALVWITNPVTLVPIYYVNWVIGRMIVPGDDNLRMNEAYIRLQALVKHSPNFFDLILEPGTWKQIGTLIFEMGIELWIGSFALGMLLAIAGYFSTLHGVMYYRERRRQQREQRQPRTSNDAAITPMSEETAAR